MDATIAPQARSDIVSILAWTERHFGPQTVKPYGRLIKTAIQEVAADPELPGSTGRPEICDNCRTYHLFFSREKAGRGSDRIRNPRHFLVYRVTANDAVEIGRVLHDSMELEKHLPEEYRSQPE